MKYKIWDKKETIYTPGHDKETGKDHFTADEWIQRNSWVARPGAKMIICNEFINGKVSLEFYSTKDMYQKLGAEITDDMTDEEVLQAIEDFENKQRFNDEPMPEERIAAALEAQVMMAEDYAVNTYIDDKTTTSDKNVGESPAYNRVKRNYEKGLWGSSLVKLAAEKGRITMDEMAAILG